MTDDSFNLEDMQYVCNALRWQINYRRKKMEKYPRDDHKVLWKKEARRYGTVLYKAENIQRTMTKEVMKKDV